MRLRANLKLHRLLVTILAIGAGACINGLVLAQSLRNWRQLADKLVEEEVASAGVTNERVLRAMRETPRHEFMPANQRRLAYYDMALPIGDEQTISPPFVVAYMTQEIDPQPTDRVLEIGTGSGYQAAVLSPLVKEVYTIEIVERLGRRAERTLERLGYKNVHVRVGDGFKGWPEKAPFDKIIVTCSPESVPQPLIEQLREGGQMIIPVGERYQQNLYRMTKRNGKLEREPLQATLFVPMTGAAEAARQLKPDPLRPQIRNGSFEEVLKDKGAPVGWHYLRQATAETVEQAPAGARVIRFTNSEPGRMSQALQGFAVDGRRVSRISASCQVRGEDIAPGPDRSQPPALVITFYDERRAVIDSAQLGPWTGSFPWRKADSELRVPLAAREAIVRIGLHGATGLLELDVVALSVVAAE
jgi:protein-L-isoaspartate(D-aspartate) O-methyltransferase